ncbi:hypothetical protein CLV51_102576 [Chitinophaga niastensis]|uniref:GLPGLI family protein n=1 Tax=Chitinophaga niastensis TaxID=536980 RepID=A0A2P8HNC6_CHINA|nr:hypothetical protein [Chitinophaga niastensis]PSL47719.1 hypothetical protein CLV51_102576 [Chitinophaga niastensis]
MKTLFLLLTGVALSLSGMAQVIKVQPVQPMTDSITYQTENVVLIFDRQVLLDYMVSMDTTLRQSKNNNRVFRNIQFVKLNATDMGAHYRKAYCYLEDTTNKDLSYRTDKMNMLWAEDGGILLPYVEEILPGLLVNGTLRVIERSNKAVQPSYKMIAEPIDGTNYRVFRLNSGKEIFRESTFCVEQLTRR